jgi:hypothetical protein
MNGAMVEEARAALAVSRLLADEPERDDVLVWTFLDATSRMALAHLCAALLRDAPDAGAILRRYGLHLALQEVEP